MSNTTADLIRLPHSGLRVPDLLLKVTALRELPTSDGVAFTSTLRYDGKIVGTIENGGYGGPTEFDPRQRREFGEQAVAAYAARCRNDDGETVTAEDLLNELVTEYDWSRRIARSSRKGRSHLRLMDHMMFGRDEPVGAPWPRREASCAKAADRVALAAQLMHKMPPGKHAWWQIWFAERWQDVTPRPAGVPAHLYC